MYDFNPYLTNDGSIGLYNKDFNDIYHSATGALTEAYEKFVLPIDMAKLLSKDSIKVLDICYGIGYNSKSFLNFIFENFVLKNFTKNNFFTEHSIDTIYTNNNKNKEAQDYTYEIYPNNASDKQEWQDTSCIAQVYDNNILSKISITAIDNDKILSFLSPFINTDINKFSNTNLNFQYKNIEKYLSKKKFFKSKKINKLINFLIFQKIVGKYPEIYQNYDVLNLLHCKKYDQIFNKDIRGIFDIYSLSVDNLFLKNKFLLFLHNIYYKHISNKYKNTLKRYKLEDINFELKIDDARFILKNDDNKYNLIFLDAFTPSKCPCLWSYDFFKLLYEHLENDGMILTYSSSASVRNAMVEAGFYIGNIFNERENRFNGTIAVKNSELIKYPLSEYDLGLLKTTAGIFYRDKNLSDPNEAIIARRNIDIKNSNLISSSKYRKLNS